MRLLIAGASLALGIFFAAAPAVSKVKGSAGDAGLRALCLLNPGDGEALLPGYTVGDFIRKGKSSGRLKAVIETRSGNSHILRFLLFDALSLKATPVSLQFREVEPRPQCNGKRAAELEGAAFNFQRVNDGNAMVGALSVMYTVIQEELNEKLSKAEKEEHRSPQNSEVSEARPAPSERDESHFTPGGVRLSTPEIERKRDACIEELARKNIIPSPDNVRRYCE